MKDHKDRLKSVFDEFMRVKFRIGIKPKGVLDPKSGGLVSVA
jgi:hypothetical protein